MRTEIIDQIEYYGETTRIRGSTAHEAKIPTAKIQIKYPREKVFYLLLDGKTLLGLLMANHCNFFAVLGVVCVSMLLYSSMVIIRQLHYYYYCY